MFEQASKLINTAIKFKKVMNAKNLWKAKTKCPFCDGGMLYGTLNGPKKHLHMKCNKCNIVYME